MSNVKVCKDKAAVGEVVASLLIKASQVALQSTAKSSDSGADGTSATASSTAVQDRFVVALSGGSLPTIIAKHLIEHRSAVDWSKWIIVFADERVVAPDGELMCMGTDCCNLIGSFPNTLLDHQQMNHAAASM